MILVGNLCGKEVLVSIDTSIFLKMRAVCEILEEAIKLNTVVSSRIDIKINLVFHAQSDL